MYDHFPIKDNIKGAQNVIIAAVERYVIYVFFDSDPDWVGPDFIIDPKDTKGIELFREFAAKIADHFKTLI